MNANAQSQYSIEYQFIEFQMKLNRYIWLKLKLLSLVTQRIFHIRIMPG